MQIIPRGQGPEESFTLKMALTQTQSELNPNDFSPVQSPEFTISLDKIGGINRPEFLDPATPYFVSPATAAKLQKDYF